MIAKPRAIKGRGGKSDGSAVKAVGLNLGVCAVFGSSRLSGSARAVIAAQKSAEGLVAGSLVKA